MIPVILIFLGIFIYWFNFGWTLTFAPSLGLFLAAFFVVIGLVILIRSGSGK
ncbi:MAG: hypothetical protein WCT02_01380 [Candidatus Paceibacterota bacterium]